MKVYLYILITICLLPSCEKTITEFQARNFIKFFGSGSESQGNNVIIADPAESSYLFVGYDKVGGKNKILAVKTDKYGNTIWENLYEKDSLLQESVGTIVKKIDEDFIIIGTTQVNPNPETNPKLMKINRYGDIIWKTRIDRNYKLIIYDFIITGNKIIVAGEAYELPSALPKCYYACIDTAGVFQWEYSFPGIETFKRIFLNNNGKLILVGNSSISSRLIEIFEADINGGIPPNPMVEEYPGNIQIVRDAKYKKEDGSLYLLIIDQNAANTSKIVKYNSNYTVHWVSNDSPQGISGESLTLKDDGSLFIACDYINETSGVNEIKLVKFDSNGELYDDFKNLPGFAETIISTPDNGLIIVGSTESTFGTMVQLIKTDKDLYLLKP